MTTRYFGQRIKRNEDPVLLAGEALFTKAQTLKFSVKRGVL